MHAEKNSIEAILLNDFEELSIRLDKSGLQESCSARTVIRARELAKLLIDDQGGLLLAQVEKAVEILKKNRFSLKTDERARRLHLLRALETLAKDKEVQKEIAQVSKPYSHKVADQILRETLQLSVNDALKDADAKRAVLAAWFCYLRQNIGSCFATAPAIVVQNEQPLTFLRDIKDLLATGRIKRTFSGNEYVVPLSISSGVGEFKKRVLYSPNLAFSPGLKLAFDAVGIKDGFIPKEPIISAEEIIKKNLMKKHGVDEKDLEKSRFDDALQANPFFVKTKDKRGAVRYFFSDLDTAKVAFNSLTENALLKTWEFSLASFAETKPGFTRWNMYASLGFNYDQKGGIAECLYTVIKQRLDDSNQKVKDLQGEYEMIYGQLKFIEGRLRNAQSEKEASWGRIEYESKRSEFRAIEELRDKEHFKAGRFSNLMRDLLDEYDRLFPQYFQEIYDADMHEVSAGPYDDSPAGFRLLFKHGRDNTSLWSLIYTPREFIDALSSFFVMTEPQIVHGENFEGLQDELKSIITDLSLHVKSDEFLITAIQRMQEAHNVPVFKDPLEHLDKIEKKPWAYTSGGALTNLMSCYFKIDGPPQVKERWVENPLELLVFIVDTLKAIPGIDRYLQREDLSILAHSPTHAFTIRPALLKKAIEAEGFTYTWVRDHLVAPQENFIDYMFLDEEMMRFLIGRLAEKIPESYKIRFQTLIDHVHGRKNPPEFRRFVLDAVNHDPILSQAGILSEEEIDSALFSWLPLTPRSEIHNRLERLLEVDSVPEQNMQELYITAQDLQNIAKTTLDSWSDIDQAAQLSSRAQKLGYSLPPSIIFADTNWTKDWFSFTVNPGTGSLELWRVDALGQQGYPMSQWKLWLDGSRQDRTWGLFTKPYEYS